MIFLLHFVMEMEPLKETDVNRSVSVQGGGGGDRRSVVVELPLGDAVATFNLEKAVCSHGLFMMAPNHWDPLSKTLLRPLRLDSDDDDSPASISSSLIVQISHPFDTPDSLLLRVFGTNFLSPQHQQLLMDQVRRMLRLSDLEERNVREFQEIYGEAKKRGFGRVFRSPTLFEDMVKCILLCNCQWPRTLTMARALCELQLELRCPLFGVSVAEVDNGSSFRSPTAETKHFAPKTPAGKESKRKTGVQKSSTNLANRIVEVKAGMEGDADFRMDCAEISNCLQEREKLSLGLRSADEECCGYHRTSTEIYDVNSCSFSDLQSSEGTELCSYNSIGNFPSPKELASLDENFLAKRCKLGYRARRILSLARSVVEGRIQLRQLEEACSRPGLSNYSKLAEKLKEIYGFGPFTCSNVLMCMGFYHVIPTDSETIRHLKQVHARDSTVQTVQRHVEMIYGEYAPFQFLAYWSEVWSFYEERFGKLSEMPHSDYELITATNMRPKRSGQNKRIKIS